MKKLRLDLVLLASVCTYGQNNNYAKSILLNFEKNAKNIYQLEYDIQSIDTFAMGGVWNHKGFAFIKREKTDKLFVFYFAH
jgi:hypothetical protein